MQIVLPSRADRYAVRSRFLPGRREVQHVEFAARMAQQLRQVVQTPDVLQPE